MKFTDGGLLDGQFGFFRFRIRKFIEFNLLDDKKLSFKKCFCELSTPQTTIILNKQIVSDRHGKTFTILQSWLTDSS